MHVYDFSKKKRMHVYGYILYINYFVVEFMYLRMRVYSFYIYIIYFKLHMFDKLMNFTIIMGEKHVCKASLQLYTCLLLRFKNMVADRGLGAKYKIK